MADVESVYTILKEIFLVLDEGDQYLFGRYGLSVMRYYALFHLENHPGSSLSELSALLLCDKSNVTRIIKTLEKDGYVERTPHETDRRSSRLYLTPSGSRIQQEVERVHHQFNQLRFQSALPLVEQCELYPQLLALRNALAAGFSRVREEKISADSPAVPVTL
jgi:DNA-binding MarR family transcriptional regulator